MPLVKVINSNYFTPISLYKVGGTQYIENTITFPTEPDSATIYLSNSVYTQVGYYVLFDYSESTSLNPVVGDLSQVIIDTSDLLFSASYSLTNDTTGKKIILTLY